MIKQNKLPHVDNPGNGYVYVLSNLSMPGIVKIGYSMYGAKGRADSLYRNDTGVAKPFEIEFELYCPNPREIEQKAHRILDKYRVNSAREFFEVNTFNAITTILQLYLEGSSMVLGEWGDVIEVPAKTRAVLHDPENGVFAIDEFLRDEELVEKVFDRWLERIREPIEPPTSEPSSEVH